MIARKIRRGALYGRPILAISVLLISGAAVEMRAFAFDSAGADIGMRNANVPTPPLPWPHGPDYFSPAPVKSYDPFSSAPCPGPNGEIVPCSTLYASQLTESHYRSTIAHAAYAGPNASDPVIANLMDCSEYAISSTGEPLDLSKCAPLAWSDAEASSDAGWVKVRKPWDSVEAASTSPSGHAPEHMWIAQEAAKYAGLAELPLMTTRFWIRYPVADRYVASPLGGHSSPHYIVGQSWTPVSHVDIGAHAVRSFLLPELAQMPDVSSSVSDWAAGDEECPIAGVSDANGSAFGDPALDTNACHNFKKIMGSVNGSHFLPMAKVMYTHYHNLALTRIVECADIDARLKPYYLRQTNLLPTRKNVGPLDSEAHVCEREAFVYEMFAQHFLQDGWSTGHMWSRWGTPNLTDFPAELRSNPYFMQPADKALPKEVPSRRYVIAGVIASYAGTLHGAKGVLEDFLPGPLATWRNADDPLCGPKVYTPWQSTKSKDVQWRTSQAGTGPLSGAGDLFWNSSPAAHILSDSAYAEQRKRLIACTARSMRDVYRAGSRAHGPLGDAQYVGSLETGVISPDDPAVDVTGEYCWDHLVTNVSMFGAIGPAYATYDYGASQPSATTVAMQNASILEVVNRALVYQRMSQVSMAVDRWSLFMGAVSSQMNADAMRLALTLASNATIKPGGTQSALLTGLSNGKQASMLNVAPSTGTSEVPYLDVVAPRSTPLPADRYVPQMFWRAHLADVCTDNSLVATLRDRCVNAASGGGDPEACTACVEIAEPHIPMCDGTQNPPITDSKCSALGVTSTKGLPEQWFDFDARSRVITDCNVDNYWVAFKYCTGTGESIINSPADGYGFSSTPIASAPSQCGSFELGQNRVRVGRASTEVNSFVQTPRPLITAVEGNLFLDEWVAPGQNGSTQTCYPIIHDEFEPAIAARLQGLPYWNRIERGDRALTNPEDMLIGYCGMTQRQTFWNRSCADVRNLLDTSLTESRLNIGAERPDGSRDPETGYEASDAVLVDAPGEARCSMREARRFVTSCAVGTCDSGGVCVGARYLGGGLGSPASPPVNLLP